MVKKLDSNYRNYEQSERDEVIDDLLSNTREVLDGEKQRVFQHLHQGNADFFELSVKISEVNQFISDKGINVPGTISKNVGSVQHLIALACDECNQKLQNGATNYQNPYFTGFDEKFGSNTAFAGYQVFKVIRDYSDQIGVTIPDGYQFDGILTDWFLEGALCIAKGCLDRQPGGDEEVVDEEVVDEEVVDEEVVDEEVVDEEVVDEEVVDEEVVDEEVKDEEVKDEEVKDEEVKDEEVKDEEVKDEEVVDEEVVDEEVKDEEVKDEEVKDEEVKDEEVIDEEVVELTPEQIKQNDLEALAERINLYIEQSDKLISEAQGLESSGNLDNAKRRYEDAKFQIVQTINLITEYNSLQDDDTLDYKSEELDALQASISDINKRIDELDALIEEGERKEEKEQLQNTPEELRSLIMDDRTNQITGLSTAKGVKYYYTVSGEKTRKLKDDTFFNGDQTVVITAKKNRKLLEGSRTFEFTTEGREPIASNEQSLVSLDEMRAVETDERLQSSLVSEFETTVSDQLEALTTTMKALDDASAKKAVAAIKSLENALQFPKLPDDFSNRSDAEKRQWYTQTISGIETTLSELLSNSSVIPSVVDDKIDYSQQRALKDDETKIYKAGIIQLNNALGDVIRDYEGYVYAYDMKGAEEYTELDPEIEANEELYDEVSETASIATQRLTTLQTTYTNQLKNYADIDNKLITQGDLLDEYKLDNNVEKVLETVTTIGTLESKKIEARIQMLWTNLRIQLLQGEFDQDGFDQIVGGLRRDIESKIKGYQEDSSSLGDTQPELKLNYQKNIQRLQRFINGDISTENNVLVTTALSGGQFTLEQLEAISGDAGEAQDNFKTLQERTKEYQLLLAEVYQLQNKLNTMTSGTEDYKNTKQDLDDKVDELTEKEKEISEIKNDEDGESGLLDGVFRDLLIIDDEDQKVIIPLDDLSALEDGTRTARNTNLTDKSTKRQETITTTNETNQSTYEQKNISIDTALRPLIAEKGTLEETIKTTKQKIFEQIQIILMQPEEGATPEQINTLTQQKEEARKLLQENTQLLENKNARLQVVNAAIAKGYYQKQLVLQKQDYGKLVGYEAELSQLSEQISALTEQKESVDAAIIQQISYFEQLKTQITELTDVGSIDPVVQSARSQLNSELTKVGSRISELEVKSAEIQQTITSLQSEKSEKLRIASVYRARIDYIGKNSEYAVAEKRLDQIQNRIDDLSDQIRKYNEAIKEINQTTIPGLKNKVTKVENSVIDVTNAWNEFDDDNKPVLKDGVYTIENPSLEQKDHLSVINDAFESGNVQIVRNSVLLGEKGQESIAGFNAEIAQALEQVKEYQRNIREIESEIALVEKEKAPYQPLSNFEQAKDDAKASYDTAKIEVGNNETYGGFETGKGKDYIQIEDYTTGERNRMAYPEDANDLIDN